VNNPTRCELCFTMIGRADIEGSKSNVAMGAWLPQASSLIPRDLMQAFALALTSLSLGITVIFPNDNHHFWWE
jgi:hypothetical protein